MRSPFASVCCTFVISLTVGLLFTDINSCSARRNKNKFWLPENLSRPKHGWFANAIHWRVHCYPDERRYQLMLQAVLKATKELKTIVPREKKASQRRRHLETTKQKNIRINKVVHAVWKLEDIVASFRPPNTKSYISLRNSIVWNIRTVLESLGLTADDVLKCNELEPCYNAGYPKGLKEKFEDFKRLGSNEDSSRKIKERFCKYIKDKHIKGVALENTGAADKWYKHGKNKEEKHKKHEEKKKRE